MNSKKEGPDLEAIKPDSKSSKYSPNLHKWLKSQRRPDLIKVLTDTSSGVLIIGCVDNEYGDGQWLHGTALMSVLRNGKKATCFAYPMGSRHAFVELPDFWERYKEDGRCAIDPNHERHFVGDESRWVNDGDTRECQWCGKRKERLETWVETVTRQGWKPVEASKR